MDLYGLNISKEEIYAYPTKYHYPMSGKIIDTRICTAVDYLVYHLCNVFIVNFM